MMEPWLAGFLIGFFGIMTAILILHKADWRSLILLLFAFLFWDDVFSCLNHVIPAEVSPFQSIAGRTGCFLGAAAACIWRDAPKGGKVRELLCVERWWKFTGLTAMMLIGIAEAALIFSDADLFILWMIGSLTYASARKKDGDHDFTIDISNIGIATLWIWWHWESGGYAAAIYELNMIDMTGCMIYMFLIAPLFYGKPKKEEE